MFLKSTIALLDSRFKTDHERDANILPSTLPNQTISPFMPLAVITATQLSYITQRAHHKHSEMFIKMKMMLFKPNNMYGFCGV